MANSLTEEIKARMLKQYDWDTYRLKILRQIKKNRKDIQDRRKEITLKRRKRKIARYLSNNGHDRLAELLFPMAHFVISHKLCSK